MSAKFAVLERFFEHFHTFWTFFDVFDRFLTFFAVFGYVLDVFLMVWDFLDALKHTGVQVNEGTSVRNRDYIGVQSHSACSSLSDKKQIIVS